MTDTIKKTRDYLAIILSVIAILGAVGGYGAARAKSAVIERMVLEHEKLLDQNNLPVIVTNQNNMADDVREIKGDVKDLVQSFNEYVRDHP